MSIYREIGLEITNKCNYLCNHCRLSCGPYRNDIMSKDVIDASLKKVGCKAEKVIIEGGEPTLLLDIIKYVANECVKYNKKFGYPKEICLRTNCSWAISREKAANKMQKFKELGITSVELCGMDEYHLEFYKAINILDLKLLADSLNLFDSVKIVEPELSFKKLGRAKMLNELPYNNKCIIHSNSYKINVYGDIKICKVGHTCYLGSILDKSIEEVLEYDFINILMNYGIEKYVQIFMLKFNKKIQFDKFDDVCEVCHYITAEWKSNICY